MPIADKDIVYHFKNKTEYNKQYLVVTVTNNYINPIAVKIDHASYKKDGIVLNKWTIRLDDISPGQTMERSEQLFFGVEGMALARVEKISFWSIEENTGRFINLNHEIRKAGCFVATACLGYDDAVVGQLQEFRDRHLAGSCFGRAFIRFYYWVGPDMAAYIAPRPRLRKACGTTIKVAARLLPGAPQRR